MGPRALRCVLGQNRCPDLTVAASEMRGSAPIQGDGPSSRRTTGQVEFGCSRDAGIRAAARAVPGPRYQAVRRIEGIHPSGQSVSMKTRLVSEPLSDSG
jgi:hypothetical protein